jgi:hypothetical protein
MHLIDPTAFGPVIEALLRPPRLPALAVDPPNRAMHAPLTALEDGAAFAPFMVRDRPLATACRAGLWLFFDFLDEAHTISQELHTVEGSYWHALVHRREPDYENSKYWFRRVGQHPIFGRLREEAAKLALGSPASAAAILQRPRWGPFAFVDLCEASSDLQSPGHEWCRRVQQIEWELLFEHCHREGLGTERS